VLKKCSKCKEEKPLTEYTKLRTSRDGLQPLCSPCKKAASKRYYAANIEAIRKKDRDRYAADPNKRKASVERWRAANPEESRAATRRSRAKHKDKRMAECRAWYAANKDKAQAQKAQYRLAFPEQKRAQGAVERAVANGRLSRPVVCSACNMPHERIEGHHEDYTRPLDVIWLCKPCHRKVHRINANVTTSTTERAAQLC